MSDLMDDELTLRLLVDDREVDSSRVQFVHTWDEYHGPGLVEPMAMHAGTLEDVDACMRYIASQFPNGGHIKDGQVTAWTMDAIAEEGE